MKIVFLMLFCFVALFSSELKGGEQKFFADVIPKHMSIKEKKERFFALLVPAVQKVHAELIAKYEAVLAQMKLSKNQPKIQNLKKLYNLKTDEELLMALKPHPISIVLAQAAMESGWATSRFFREANNIFGMWSVDKNEPRVAAGEKRGGTRTVWLRKFETIEDSVRAYYRLLAKGGAYKEFRALRLHTDDPYLLVEKLDRYSEIGANYTKELVQVIRYNNLTKYDE